MYQVNIKIPFGPYFPGPGGADSAEPVNLLTWTTKLGCPSFGLPAHKSCPRAAGTICQNCYAERGLYRIPASEAAHLARLRWTVRCIRDGERGQSFWVGAMTTAITTATALADVDRFRIHDSGDFFSEKYARMWIEVVRNLPHIRFWVPTRAWQRKGIQLDASDPILAALIALATFPHVTVRPSALNFGDPPPEVPGLHAGTTSEHAGTPVCRAIKHKCGDCRDCWLKDQPISYHRI